MRGSKQCHAACKEKFAESLGFTGMATHNFSWKISVKKPLVMAVRGMCGTCHGEPLQTAKILISLVLQCSNDCQSVISTWKLCAKPQQNLVKRLSRHCAH